MRQARRKTSSTTSGPALRGRLMVFDAPRRRRGWRRRRPPGGRAGRPRRRASRRARTASGTHPGSWHVPARVIASRVARASPGAWHTSSTSARSAGRAAPSAPSRENHGSMLVEASRRSALRPDGGSAVVLAWRSRPRRRISSSRASQSAGPMQRPRSAPYLRRRKRPTRSATAGTRGTSRAGRPARGTPAWSRTRSKPAPPPGAPPLPASRTGRAARPGDRRSADAEADLALRSHHVDAALGWVAGEAGLEDVVQDAGRDGHDPAQQLVVDLGRLRPVAGPVADEPAEVDVAEDARLARGEGHLRARRRGGVAAERRRRVVLVEALQEEQPRIAAAPGAAHDGLPQLSRIDGCAVAEGERPPLLQRPYEGLGHVEREVEVAHVPPLGLRRGERSHPRVVDVQVRHIADVAVVPSRSRLLGACRLRRSSTVTGSSTTRSKPEPMFWA